VDINMSAEGLNQIAEMVKSHMWLEKLDLSNNSKISPEDWVYLLEAVNKNRSLKWLNLSHN